MKPQNKSIKSKGNSKATSQQVASKSSKNQIQKKVLKTIVNTTSTKSVASNRKIIVAGGAGFVGRNLIRVMQESGINCKNVIVIDKDLKWLDFVKKYGVQTHFADVSSEGDWMDLFDGAEVLVNLVAQISSKEYGAFTKNNVLTSYKLVEACQKYKVPKVIHYSSAAVLSVRKDPYSETKKESEEIFGQLKNRCVMLQPSLMYGRLDDKNIGYLINFSRKSPFFPMPGSGEYVRQPIYVDDICKLTIKMMDKFPGGKKFSINGKDKINFIDMVRAVLDQMKGIHFIVKLPIPIFKFAMNVYQTLFGKKFTGDQVDSLVAGDVFPDYPWWTEFGIEVTSFRDGAKKILDSLSLLKPVKSSSVEQTQK